MMSDQTKPAWKCAICGYIHYGEEPPPVCPACGAARSQFYLLEQTHQEEPAPPPTEPAAKHYVIVGAGIAGVSAAEAIHKNDPQASILLLSKEPELPYFRMNLTRYLAGEVEANKLDLHNQAWYEQNRIELRLNTTVTSILPAEKMLILEDQDKIPYDILILATGASPFLPPFPGKDLAGVQTLRTIHDADSILAACCEPIPVVCIGGGLLGLEVAGAIARRGVMVTVVESLAWLLPRQLDQPASLILQSKIEKMGISVITGAKTKALVGDGHVQAVELEDGRSLPASLVVISAGVSANVELARKAGLEVNRGILVDDHMRTSLPGIFAAGDEAEHHGRLYGLWVPAKSQGTIAGLSAAGKDAVYPGDPPSARLKVLGIDLFSIGQFMPEQPSDLLVSEEKDGNYACFIFREGKMIGAILLGDAKLASTVKTAVESERDFSDLLHEKLSVDKVKAALK